MIMNLLARAGRAADGARRRPRELGAATAGVMLAMTGTFAVVQPWTAVAPWPTTVVRQDAFREVLAEAGTISAARLMLYSSRIAGGPAKIVAIAPEGQMVSAGDELVRFDGTPFEQELARDTASLRQAEAERRRAAEQLRLERLSAGAEREDAAAAVGQAESDLTDEAEGRGQVALAEAEAGAAEAGREVARTRATFDDLQALLEKGFVTRIEIERAELAWQRAQEQLRLAALRRDALVQYGRPAALDRARTEVRTARERVSRQQEGAASRVAERQAALALADGRVDEIEARLAILQARLAHTVIRADAPGLVIYRDLFFGSDRRKPLVGDEVWPNQPVLAVPDSTSLVVDTRIREVDLHKLAQLTAVEVTVDAYPDLRLRAEVELVGALAQEDASRAGTRYFPVTVALLDYDSRLRTGMTARVELVVSELPDALVVPSHAIVERDGHTVCYVLRGRHPERRPVVVAADNGFDAAIAEGLAPGEVVLLVDPLATPEPR